MTQNARRRKEQMKKMQLLAFRAATALLYLGPLLAGLSGFGWELVPGFVVVFLMYLFVVRRSLFPSRGADWADGAFMVRSVTQILVQTFLIVICFAVGRGLGGVVGSLPDFSPIWTLAISFLAVPLSRLLAMQPDAKR